MHRQIKLAAISPHHLNLNGDLGNLLVLQKRLSWRDVSSSISHLDGSEILSEFDFVLLGHGSNAAWTQLLSTHPDLPKNVVSFINKGGAVLAVASAADFLRSLLTGVDSASGAWVSKFVEMDSVVGYLNTASKSNYVEWIENALLTQLHGPVLAKNPALADEIISKNGWSDISIRSVELHEVDELAEQSRKIAFEN